MTVRDSKLEGDRPVALPDVVEALGFLQDGDSAHVHRRTGEVFVLSADDRGLVEDVDAVEDADLPAWQRDLLPKLREVATSDDWLPLPSKFDLHDYDILCQFVDAVHAPSHRDALARAIRGSGAFRRFKELANRYGIEKEWYAFRDAAIARIARAWLEDLKLPFTESRRARLSGDREYDAG